MDLGRARQGLEEERAHRQSLAERLRREGSDPVESSELSKIDQHPAELGTETFERELELTTLMIVEAELKDIDDALRKLEQGTYGVCEACGKPIDPAQGVLDVLELGFDHGERGQFQFSFEGLGAKFGRMLIDLRELARLNRIGRFPAKPLRQRVPVCALLNKTLPDARELHHL